MEDNWLIAIALCVSGIGTALLMVALVFLEIPLDTPESLRAAADGDPVRVRGEVAGMRSLGTSSVLLVRQEVLVPVMVDGNVTVASGECIDAQGKRSTFNGEAQVAASRVVRC